jgi:hypothetical protein
MASIPWARAYAASLAACVGDGSREYRAMVIVIKIPMTAKTIRSSMRVVPERGWATGALGIL